MGFLDSLVSGGNPVTAIVSGILPALGDTAEKLRSALTGDLPPDKKAELESHLADIDAKLSEAQNAVNLEEAKSARFFVAGWRPATGWICVAGTGYAFLVQPLLAWCSTNWGWVSPPAIDVGTLLGLLTAMLGMSGFRTLEKYHGTHGEH